MQTAGLALLWHAVVTQLISLAETIDLLYQAHGEFIISGARIYVHPADK